MNEEIKNLIRVFENKVISAWVYDTELSFKDYPSGLQFNKAKAKYAEADEARANLYAAIEKLS